jgi:CHAT domain-containing protein/tetratricopeptide (TPR) repeat protein
MRRGLGCFFAAIFLLLSSVAPSGAQQTDAADQFVALYQRWQGEQDLEARITLGEQALALEPSLNAWPLADKREHVKGEIWFGVGSAYVSRTRGVRADNIEKGITHLGAALKVWTFETDPQNWARAHNNLGIAYWGRIRGERADNQESAIAHFEAALKVLTREASREEWARLRNNLAVVYSNRVRGERSANLEASIGHFEAALTVFTRQSHAQLWGMVQNNLGIAYNGRIAGKPADNREKAIGYLDLALTVLTREAMPHEWASAQSNLAVIYSARVRGDRAENQEKALERLEDCLTVFTPDGFPQQWAKAQNITGNVYSDRLKGDRADNQKKAIAAYEAALSVFTRDAFPHDHMRTSRALARVHLELGAWQQASVAHSNARDAFLVLFGQGLEEAEARTLISDAGPLFAEAAFAALQRGEPDAALELADEGRARLLAVSMRLQALELPPAKRRRLTELRTAIRSAQQAVERAQGTERGAAVEQLIALRQELLGIIQAEGNPEAALAEARAVAAGGGAVVMPVVTSYGGKLMVLTKAGQGTDVAVIDMPELTPDRLSKLLVGETGGKAGGWVAAYFINYVDAAEQNRRWPEWLGAIEGLGPELWRLIGARLDATLKERGVKPGAQLVWLPSGWLGILPLGVAQDPASKRRLSDAYEIVYAPSLETFAAARRAVAKAAPPTLAVVINPTGDLPGTEKEGAIVASYFASGARTLLERDAATPKAVLGALKGKSYWHFASHGTFSWSDVRQSALIMRDMARLSVGSLLETEGLGRPRLVALSACETGLLEITLNPDEFVGLPGAFMALGASGVIGTLWPVSDAATALLIAKFYELHMGSKLPPPTALSRAQAWLRTATNDDLQGYARATVGEGRMPSRHLAEIESELSAEGMSRSRNSAAIEWVTRDTIAVSGKVGSPSSTRIARPYAHPYFWAGFVYTGL